MLCPFPELAEMVGKNVEVIVIEDKEVDTAPPYNFWDGPTAEELAAQQGVGPATSLEQLQGESDTSDVFAGFDKAIREWHREPWRVKNNAGRNCGFGGAQSRGLG